MDTDYAADQPGEPPSPERPGPNVPTDQQPGPRFEEPFEETSGHTEAQGRAHQTPGASRPVWADASAELRSALRLRPDRPAAGDPRRDDLRSGEAIERRQGRPPEPEPGDSGSVHRELDPARPVALLVFVAMITAVIWLALALLNSDRSATSTPAPPSRDATVASQPLAAQLDRLTAATPSVATTDTSTTDTTAPPSSTDVTDDLAGYPTAAPDTVEVEDDEDTRIDALRNDGPGDSPLAIESFEIVTWPEFAKEIGIEDGRIRYKPSEYHDGVDYFEYLICNTNGLCSVGSVTVVIT